MLRIANILVPVDSADSALSQALFWGHRLQATVHVVETHVAGGDSVPAPPTARPSSAVRRRVQDVAQRMDLPLTNLRAMDVDAPSLTQGALWYAAEHDIDLIVAALPAHERFDLTRRTSLPVHIVGRAAAATQPIRRVLAPIDFSRHAQRSLTHARMLAALFDAPLHVLHVLERPPYVALNSTDMLALSDAKLPERRALRRAKTLLEDTDGPAVDVAFHIVHGDPAHEISSFADEPDSDLVVLSSHGSTGQSDHPLGTVADKLVRRLDASIFLVHSFGPSLVAPPSNSAASSS
ncbi:MAG: universal stress protein [Bacteroidetes bacterium]|jgi:nucleotide-binding universal stress UspA family protein|nr:universal stress protein [Bacteroidota bacterium]